MFLRRTGSPRPLRGGIFATALLLIAGGCGPGSSIDRALSGDAGTGGTGGVSGSSGGNSGLGGTATSGGSGGSPAAAGNGGGSDGNAGPVDAAILPDVTPPPPDIAPPPPDFAPPPPDTAPPPPDMIVLTGPFLEGSASSAALGGDLTAAGSVDWMHFGRGTATTVNRKRLVSQQLSMHVLGSGSLCRYDDRPVAHSWTDGTPTLSASSIRDGVGLGDVAGRGFEIRAPGSVGQRRTLKVHVGAWGARAKLTAQLSSGGAYGYTDNSLSVQNPGGDLVYTVVYQTSAASQSLVVRWTIETLNHEYGNVTLQAVTLSE